MRPIPLRCADAEAGQGALQGGAAEGEAACACWCTRTLPVTLHACAVLGAAESMGLHLPTPNPARRLSLLVLALVCKVPGLPAT